MRRSLLAAEPDLAKQNTNAIASAICFKNAVKVRFSSSTHAMLAIISVCHVLLSSIVATPLQPATPDLINVSSVKNASAVALGAFQCFDPSFQPPRPLHRIEYSGCTDAADRMLTDTQVDVPILFSRDQEADFPLPWRVQSQNCRMVLDVTNQHDEDIMSLQTTHGIALALCSMCVGGYYKQGGTTPVGPRGVVRIFVYGTEPFTEENTDPGASQLSHVTARYIEPGGSDLPGVASLAVAEKSVPKLSSANMEDG